MSRKSEHKDNMKENGIPPRFHERFNIEVGLEAARERFINRLFNLIDEEFLGFTKKQCNLSEYVTAFKYIAYKLGIRYKGANNLEYYSGNEFPQVLRTLEALFQAFQQESYANSDSRLDTAIKLAISESEIDLGIEWRDGLFYPSGAKLLDETLINENLKWLSDPKYSTVLAPFEKGLHHFLEAQRQPERLTDVITDMYEAVEKMARITNDNNATLGVNAEKFIGNLGLSDYYKTMLREYTKYAHEFRHAVKQGRVRVPPLPNEVEAFVYTTGLFIRLAVQQLGQATQST